MLHHNEVLAVRCLYKWLVPGTYSVRGVRDGNSMLVEESLCLRCCKCVQLGGRVANIRVRHIRQHFSFMEHSEISYQPLELFLLLHRPPRGWAGVAYLTSFLHFARWLLCSLNWLLAPPTCLLREIIVPSSMAGVLVGSQRETYTY